MSKLFSWFKKDTPEQDTASASPAGEPESQAPLEEAKTLEQGEKAEQILHEIPAVHEPVLKTSEKENASVIDGAAQVQAKEVANSDTTTPGDVSTEVAQIKQAFASEHNVQCESLPEIVKEMNNVDASTDEKTAQEHSLFTRLKASLARTKNTIGSGFSSLLMGKAIDDDLYEELETQLLLADVGMNTTNKIIEELTKNAKSSQLKDSQALSAMLQLQMQTILDKVNTPIDFSIATDSQGNKHPFVILMVGVNGVGKTTTIGKLAKQFQAQGKSVMLAAGDTFRAAAVEQLQVWGERNNIPVVAQQTGADSASVIYDAIESAKAKNADILIADTAGRLQNKEHLMEELKKVVRVMQKLNPQAPHEIMLTLDASTGQNAVSQTKIFNEAVGITGINLTKLDGTAKGGVIFALADQFAIPVRYIGIGEGIDDLRTFESKAFVEALFSE
jgi:fused signal recognition particle receptor